MHSALKLIHHRFQQSQPGAAGLPGQPTHAPDTPTVTARPGTTPLVLDSPHSGTQYPADFGSACDLPTLRRAEDTHVEKIYAFAPAMGAAWIEAHFPRIYLDANRDTTELDTSMLDGAWTGPISTDPKVLSKVRLGKGLIWKFTDEGEPIYHRQLTVQEVRGRIDRCWRPYHAAVAQAIDAAHARHGYSIHLNCHSMPAVAGRFATEFPGLVHADFVVGDRDGTTADPALSALICDHLRACGYSVEYNHPYKGVELVRRYGNPAQHRHSIQVEINRKLYMDEQTLEQDPAGMARLQTDLKALVQRLLSTDPR
ncbi:N-formylglutamate amidohydrolase [Acidovorax sp.]|uniref:N-formylglutamate amidohydrolase n=1 Tax=Acidovorax sp. TaxID=1872122 RepID=UPI0025C4B170|nr:N-formylglutamate amidohydrolase [Acidovorax sp.]MCI5068604.1 N-formylglutamate amidohydrolase [Acidovorax sp.]